MMPSTSPCLTSKLTSRKRPEFLDLVALHDLPPARKIGRLACEIARLAAQSRPAKRVALALGRLMPDQIALGEIFDGDDDVGHWVWRRSDQIGKALFHFPELANSEPQEKGGDTRS